MRAVFGAVAVALLLALPATAVADGTSPAMPERGRNMDDDPGSLFAAASAALREGRAGDAIGQLEALADRGVLDAAASYDRGLAYAMRVRIGAEVPGDLGRAAHGFEEARELSRDPRLVEDASRALTVVRSEIARRRTRAGESIEIDAGRSLARAVARLLSEDVWAALAGVFSAILAAGLFARWLSPAQRPRVLGGVAAGVAAPLLVVSLAMTLASRHDRLTLREAVVVSANARPTDDRGMVVAAGVALPEGARVEVVDTRSAWTRVRFGETDAWVASSALRELARVD
jgi:hypothetical protein